ncbi:MAG: oxygenase MpaB family protein [Acidimicrobiia bacterium]|nr:oxygenase MpaB family protein [Acidimicrobiia bacterium]
MSPAAHLFESIRTRLTAGVTGPFSHAGYPLASTLEHRGDPGLFGPDSVTWRVVGDVAAFIGGIRALLIQAAHPEVVAGVADHSSYRSDPLGRLSRTSAYVTATCYGANPEVEQAIEIVRTAHRPVHGSSTRGRRYSAGTPEYAAWVHNALTDSFLVAYQTFGRDRLSPAEADAFVAEQTAVGSMLRADPLPDQAASLSSWLTNHPEAAPSPGMQETVAFLVHPPLSRMQRAGYRLLFNAAVATIPLRLRRMLGVRRLPGSRLVGRGTVATLRWALGSSPSWNLALVRVGAPIPEGLFVQPLPVGDPTGR